ncbi:MAG: ComF family protein [Cyclobacteriaceae bacterium]
MMSSVMSDLVSLLFPMNCYACGEPLVAGERCICTVCRNDLPKLDNQDLIRSKFDGAVVLKYAFAYLIYRKSGLVQSLMHHLKYRDRPELGGILGNWFGAELIEKGLDKKWDIILPVPLHPSKLRQRGYNQSDYFAQGLSEVMEISWSNRVLRRVRKNTSQTSKGRWERHINVDSIFSVQDKTAIRGKRVLLVDDILTTGATLQACSLSMVDSGVKEISIAAIALAQ